MLTLGAGVGAGVASAVRSPSAGDQEPEVRPRRSTRTRTRRRRRGQAEGGSLLHCFGPSTPAACLGRRFVLYVEGVWWTGRQFQIPWTAALVIVRVVSRSMGMGTWRRPSTHRTLRRTLLFCFDRRGRGTADANSRGPWRRWRCRYYRYALNQWHQFVHVGIVAPASSFRQAMVCRITEESIWCVERGDVLLSSARMLIRYPIDALDDTVRRGGWSEP